MPDERLEQVVNVAYKNWKRKFSKEKSTACPDLEALACFKEGLLPKREEEGVRQHLLFCDKCSENVLLDAKIQALDKDVPLEFVQAAKDLCPKAKGQDVLEVILALKGKFLELIQTTADFLEAQDRSLEPALLRGEAQRKTAEEVQLVKYFGRIKVNLRIQKEGPDKVRINLALSDKKTGRSKDDLRVSLKKDSQEFESYIVKQGEAAFTQVSPGRYEIEICEAHKAIGRIMLELR